MTYEEMLDAAHAIAKVSTTEQLVDGFERVCKRDLTQPMHLALYGALRAELMRRLLEVEK